MNGYHLQHGVSCWQPFPHHGLEQRLALFLPVLHWQLDLELLYQLGRLFLLEVHDGTEHLHKVTGHSHRWKNGTLGQQGQLIFTSKDAIMWRS